MKRLLLTAMVCSYFSIACSAQGRATVSGGHLTTNNAVLDIVDTALTLPAVTAARIKITAGDTTLYAAMYDNETAREFMRLLPLTLTAFDRIGLVKSTVLPRPISDKGERTRTYKRGAVFYWPEGPEVAFCYSDHLPQTVVPIIHIGMIESGVEFFRSYTGKIVVELVE